MKSIHEILLDQIHEGAPLVVATVVRTRGSTPREVGAKMIIDEAGKATGTIGGGCGEADVWVRARDVMATGRPELVQVDLISDSDEEGGRACGGIMYVHLERVN